MRTGLWSVSLSALLLAGTVGVAQAEIDISVPELGGLDISIPDPWVNVAINTARIDGSINISADDGGRIGNIGSHRKGLGSLETLAAGAVNNVTIETGAHSETVEFKGALRHEQAAGFIGVDASMGHVEVDRFRDTDVHVDWASLRGAAGFYGSSTGLAVSYESTLTTVPSAIIVNAAYNNSFIDGSVNIDADSWGRSRGGSIGNIGSISTTAIGAQNVATISLGVESIGN
ncbi:hypothetical protein [Aquibaculum arenosum]|uniref:Porin n=1 Tax=Aquibaculum arenosum TaxID=3032591 RepID=A0ABT5YQU6_9PROT|nr:hypothetical protein [Fodinicurvata sp. CAU 1616]MDF2097340.1 hypothetical protein [Fodinicurvata sp. CAU 1616]